MKYGICELLHALIIRSIESKALKCTTLGSTQGHIVSFPDSAFTKDKGLAHFARNLGLPDLASEG